MTTATEIFKDEALGPALFSVVEHGVRREVRDLDAFRAECPEADEILEELLMSGRVESGEASFELIDAQLLIQHLS